MAIAENVHVEIKTRRHMTKIKLTEKDVNTISDMIYLLKELDNLDYCDHVREHIEKDDFVPVIPYEELVDWLKACKETLSLGVVWDESTDEVLTMVPGDIVELSY